MINSKKYLIYVTCIVLIGIIGFIPFVLGYIGVVNPYDYTIDKGKRITGDVDSFEDIDGDYIHFRGKSYSPGTYEIEVNTWFDRVSNPGNDNVVWIKFKFSGGGTLHIFIYYYGGGSAHYTESSTGGNWVTKSYDIANYKSVYDVYFDNKEWWNPGNLQIDYLGAHYGLS